MVSLRDEEGDFVDDDENEDSDFGADLEDEDVSEEEEEEEEEAAATTKSKKRARKPAARSSSKQQQKKKQKKGSQFFEEEADEEDEEDGDEEEGGGRRKKSRASHFFDDIAAVDDDEEEEEADEDADDILADNAEDLGGEDLHGGSAAHYRELDRQTGRRDGTEEDMLAYLQERYKNADIEDEEDDYEAYGEEEDVGQQGLQPSKEDPGLFIVQCRIGCEREACLQLLQKVYNFQESGKMLEVKSAVCLDHLKGFIYVEAFKDSHVLEAIRGLRTIYSFKGAKLVPLRERPAAISVNRQARAAIARDSWVRVRGGLYKDDLAKVYEVDYAEAKAVIKLVPRLDLAAMAAGTSRRMPFGRQAVRPPPRPFRAKEALEMGLSVQKDKQDSNAVMVNTQRFTEGYTLKKVGLKSLILQDVAPPLEEISRFNAAGQSEADDMNDPTASLETLLKALPDGATPKATYVKGDRVAVIAGDLNTLEGVVEGVRAEEGKLLVRPDMMREQVVELEVAEVQKLFKAGDHVRVLNGPHAGERGMVISLAGTQCVLLPDTRQVEIKVFVRDITEAKESSTGVETLGGKYELHDLVQLDAHTSGIIVSIDKDTARVLTNQSTLVKNDIRLCREADIVRKLQTNRASTTDMSGNTVSVGDYVTVLDAAGPAANSQQGPKKERGGTVHAISRGVVFVKCLELVERGGFLVARNRQVRVRGSTPAAAAAGPGGPGQASVLASPQHVPGGGAVNPFGGRGPGGPGPQNSGGRGGRDYNNASGLLGQELVVRSGPYARYRGRVKQETATHLQLELHAINRIVTVKKQDVLGSQGAPRAAGFNPGRGQPTYGFVPSVGPPRTPAHIMATPMHPSMGGSTPVHPSRTPMHPSMTPMHPSMTPMHPGMTPMHPGATPAHPSQDLEPEHMYQPAPGPGSRGMQQPPQPAAATPGMGGYPAPTPGGGAGGYPAAPTPGMAETPGGTYRDQGNARTPGAAAATPGGPDSYGYTPGADMSGGPAPAATPGMHDPLAPVAPSPRTYYPTPGAGVTPGLTPSLTPGLTPSLGGGIGITPGFTPGMAYTPGLEGATPAGTPGFGGPVMGMGLGAPGAAGPAAPAMPQRPDYAGVLVTLPTGGVGVAGSTDGEGNTQVVPLSGGAAVVVDVVELVEVERKDWVKVVLGPLQGKVGQVLAQDGPEVVLDSGDMVDVGMVGKLHTPPEGEQHGVTTSKAPEGTAAG